MRLQTVQAQPFSVANRQAEMPALLKVSIFKAGSAKESTLSFGSAVATSPPPKASSRQKPCKHALCA
jgi:hypothetical protein